MFVLKTNTQTSAARGITLREMHGSAMDFAKSKLLLCQQSTPRTTHLNLAPPDELDDNTQDDHEDDDNGSCKSSLRVLAMPIVLLVRYPFYIAKERRSALLDKQGSHDMRTLRYAESRRYQFEDH